MRNVHHKILIAALTGSFLGVSVMANVQAQEAPPSIVAAKPSAAERLREKFDAADTNHDGQVTPKELDNFVQTAPKLGGAPAN